MYEAYWGFQVKPFANTPDPQFFFPSAQHEEALARLAFAIEERLGAASLTGVFGCGKTVVIHALIVQLGQRAKVALVTNPRLSDQELLRQILYQLGLGEQAPTGKADLLQLVYRMALDNHRDGKDTVVIVDEAHLIDSSDIFEELRLLLNYQLADRFLLTLLVVGQPELSLRIARFKQFAQRVALSCHLDHFKADETVQYVQFRLARAGCERALFAPDALAAIHEASGGIPRRINHVCTFSLLLGASQRASVVNAEIVREAAAQLVG